VTTVKPEKILIAMSGGVDSSVAALLLSEAGCECVGATMRLFHNEDAGVSREKSCCSLDDVEDARSVAYQLGMPFYVFNFTDGFGEQVTALWMPMSAVRRRTPASTATAT